MDAAREGNEGAVVLRWTRYGRRSFAELVSFLKESPYANAAARTAEISAAIKRLRTMPSAYPVRHIRGGKPFRCLVVARRFFVYYIYYPPRAASRAGRISIRGVKHAARRRPFAGVREPSCEYGGVAGPTRSGHE